MTITDVAYCTREDVQRTLNLADSPELNARVDQAIQAGAGQVHGVLHRRFYPETKTVLFDQPEGANLWLYEEELAAAPTQVLSGGVAMTVNTDVFLRPKSGPPYRWLEVSYGGSVFWQSVSTPQASISVTGDFHYPTRSVSAGTIASSPSSSSATVLLSDSSSAGVGSLILIDTERMIVSDKTMNTTGATITADPGTSKSAVAVSVSNGALINAGEMILVDSERMQVEYVVGNTLTVRRAVNGSALASHAIGAAISAPRTASLQRAKYGTPAAAHSSGAAITLLAAPSLVRELNIAYAINNTEAALGAYSRSATPDMINRYKDRGLGVMDLENQAVQRYGRISRTRAI